MNAKVRHRRRRRRARQHAKVADRIYRNFVEGCRQGLALFLAIERDEKSLDLARRATAALAADESGTVGRDETGEK